MIVGNPRTIVIDQGTEPIPAPCLLILNVHGLCMLVCTSVCREYESAKRNTYLVRAGPKGSKVVLGSSGIGEVITETEGVG